MMIAVNIIVILVILGLIYLTIKKSKGIKRIIILAIIGIVSGLGIWKIMKYSQEPIQDAYGAPVYNFSIVKFNEQWEEYKGKQKGTRVKNLISNVTTNNAIYYEEPNKVISLNGKIEIVDLREERNSIKNGAIYNVELEYENGLVHAITVRLEK